MFVPARSIYKGVRIAGAQLPDLSLVRGGDWKPPSGQRVRRRVLILQEAHHFGIAQSVQQPTRVKLFIYDNVLCSFWRQSTENVGRECERG